ncbi:hypothetical protein FO519_005503, partial [Halicephalobus sp. NKZ332]
MSGSVVGAYLLGSNGLRYKYSDFLFPKNVWYEYAKPTSMKGDTLVPRAESVLMQFQKENEKKMIDVLVIVNSNLYTLQAVKNVAEMAKLYAHEVHVVSPSFARVMYSLKESGAGLAVEGDRIVVVTVANETDITFHVLQVEKNGLIRMIFYSDSKYPESLGELVSVNFEYGPSFLVFLASNQNKIIRKAEEMRKFVQKGIILTYDRWDHMLNEGGLFKAHELIKLTTDRSCNLANFSDGIFVDFGKKSSQMVLKPGQPLPLRGTVTKKLTSGITVNAFFYADIVDVYKEIKLTSKNAMPQMSGLSNSHFRIEISVDEFGIPTASSAILTEDDLRKEFLTQRYIVVCSLFTGDV